MEYGADPREESTEADVLDKMAVSIREVRGWEVMCHTELVSNTDSNPPIPQEGTWMIPILKFILNTWVPEEPEQARKSKIQAPRFLVFSSLSKQFGRLPSCYKITLSMRHGLNQKYD